MHHRLARALTLILLGSTLLGNPAWAWGPTAHRLVPRYAVSLTPEPLRAMLGAHLEELAAASVAPDERKSDPAFGSESRRHYIDLDSFEPYPFKGFPHGWEAAAAKYGAQRLESQGTVPWAIAESFQNLSESWRDGDPAWLRWAGDLSHYVADIHQPFHATANFDGQKTGNRGIHALFENVMVDSFWREGYFNGPHRSAPLWLSAGAGLAGGVVGFLLAGALGAAAGGLVGALAAELWSWWSPSPLVPVTDPLEEAFAILTDSYAQIEPLLQAHDQAQRYRQTNPRFYRTFWEAGAREVMVRQLNRAALDLARFWTGAWLAAGRPEF